MTLTFWSWISFWTNTNVVIVVYQTPSIIKTRGTRTCWNCKKKYAYTRINLYFCYICTASYLCLPTNPCMASDPCPLLKSVSSNKSMSYEITVPPNPCPLESLLNQICVLPSRFSLRSVSFTLAEKWRHNNIRWRCFPRLRKHCIPLLLERI